MSGPGMPGGRSRALAQSKVSQDVAADTVQPSVRIAMRSTVAAQKPKCAAAHMLSGRTAAAVRVRDVIWVSMRCVFVKLAITVIRLHRVLGRDLV